MLPPSPTSTVATSMAKQPRGAFIVLEGVDRTGKTTQCGLLLKHLLQLGLSAMAMRFPQRTTAVGSLIDGYLKSSDNLNDRAIHLLFSANRWEAVDSLKANLSAGTNIVCDRYAYSGVAFSSTKPGLSMDWCKAPDMGLPAPDAVIFLDLSADEAEKRGGFGEERYETREMQLAVRKRFAELRETDTRTPWHVIDASQSLTKVTEDICNVVDKVLLAQQEESKSELKQLWTDGVVDLSSSTSAAVEEDEQV